MFGIELIVEVDPVAVEGSSQNWHLCVAIPPLLILFSLLEKLK
jgi:hypothetical protein